MPRSSMLPKWVDEEQLVAAFDALAELQRCIRRGRVQMVIPPELARVALQALLHPKYRCHLTRPMETWAVLVCPPEIGPVTAIKIPPAFGRQVIVGFIRPGAPRELTDWVSTQLDLLELDELTRLRLRREMELFNPGPESAPMLAACTQGRS